MSTKKTDQTLKKCEDLIERLQELKKALAPGVVNKPSNRTPVNALGVGWSQDPSTGAFHHSTHGIISTMKNPEGAYDIVHGGRRVGSVGDIGQAGLKIKNYVNSLTAGDTGMYNVDPMGKDEDDVEKSGYGPKGAGQYRPADNARRKATNVGAETVGTQRVKSYTHGKVFQQKTPKGPAGPVKQYTPAQIAAINEARKLKKNAETSAWANHNEFPNADVEVEKLGKTNPVQKSEDMMANQLANLMQGKAMLGQNMPFAATPPPQPTDEELFGHLVVTEEMEKAAEAKWKGNAFNRFLQEATKPISSRFSSPEEEEEYWKSIKVSDSGQGNEGY